METQYMDIKGTSNQFGRNLERFSSDINDYIKYLSMIRLLKCIFYKNSLLGTNSWEEDLLETINTLDRREAEVIKSRWGLEDGHPQTLEIMANKFGVTRERIRQIEARGIRKLRHPLRKKMLIGYTQKMATEELNEINRKFELEAEKNKIERNRDLSDQGILILNLPTRIQHALLRGGYDLIGKIENARDEDLLKIRNVGIQSIRFVRNSIKEELERKI